MVQRSFPLTTGLEPDAPDEVVFGVFDVLRNEAYRAAFVGVDADAPEPVKFTVQLSPDMDAHARALAVALGTSRRALASKLLTGAILETLNTLRNARGHEVPTREEISLTVVWDEYLEALEEIRSAVE
jgi:hypothetical protein